MHKKKKIPIKRFITSHDIGASIFSNIGWTNISIPRSSSLLSECFFTSVSTKMLGNIHKTVVRKNQESLFETFSKRSPPPSKNLSSLQKYIPNGSYLRYFYQTKQKQKFLVFLSILAIFLGFYGGREYLRPKYRGQR